MSEPIFDDYASLLKLFYSRVVKGHPNVVRLTRNLASIIEDISKVDHNTLGVSRLSRKRS